MMINKITAEIDKSEYGYDDFLNYRIDGFWLDEKLEEHYPDHWYGGTVPTLLFGMEVEREEEIVWERILPDENQSTHCPILMCPDDNDFSCTIIIAEIVHQGAVIKWQRLGVDQTKVHVPQQFETTVNWFEEYDAEKIGTTVNWFDKIGPFNFRRADYLKMIEDFKKQFEIDQQHWESRLQQKG